MNHDFISPVHFLMNSTAPLRQAFGRFFLALGVGLALLAAPGCGGRPGTADPAKEKEAGKPSQPLTVVVVDDAELGKAIEAEWRSRTEGEVKIRQATTAEVTGTAPLPGDVIVFPTGLLGELVEGEQLLPLPAEVTQDEALNLRDIYPHIRLHEITWGGKTYALPLGSPQLVLAYRADIFEKLGITPPATWDEYQQVVTRLGKREELGELAPSADQPWRATLEPLGEGFAGQLLLARAAAYAAHKEQLSPLFDLDKLRPLVDQPPYVRALDELAAAAAGQPAEGTPQSAWREMLAGHCGMALCWPVPDLRASAEGNKIRIGFAELPGSPAVYSQSESKWQQRGSDEDPRVPLLGMAGRLAGVAATAENEVGAQALVAWLAGPEVGGHLATRSESTTVFRASQESLAGKFVLPADAAIGGQYALAVHAGQFRPQWSPGVRLPGREEYLVALDKAVQSKLKGETESAPALAAAAKKWEEVTARRGVKEQKRALENSLGLQGPE